MGGELAEQLAFLLSFTEGDCCSAGGTQKHGELTTNFTKWYHQPQADPWLALGPHLASMS